MLRSHNAIGAPVSFPRDDGDLGNSGFSKRKEQFCAVLDDAAKLLLGPREKSGDIFKCDQRNVEGVAETHETCAFHGTVDIQNAGKKCRLIADDADRTAIEPRKTHHNIFGVVFVHFEEVAVVNDGLNDILHVVGLLRVGGNKRVERFIAASCRIRRGAARRVFHVVRRKKTHQLADHGKAIGIVTGNKMRDAALLVVRHRAAQLLLGDFLMSDGLDDVGAGDEHVRGFPRHEDEIGDGRRVDRAARARAHDGADLRDDPTSQSVAQKNIGIAGQRSDALLDARSAGIVQADDRRPCAHREVHDLADLFRVRLRERTAEDGEVLREYVN